MLKYLIPLILFIVMAVFLAIGLNLKPNEIPSPLLNKPSPAFAAPKLQAPNEKLATADLKGQVWLFNVWASWCVSCREEHPVLNEFAKQKAVTIIGLNYKDDPAAAKTWLDTLGNPYNVSIMDQDGRIGLDWGVYGVPETFVMDKKGIVRYKHTGPVMPDDVQNVFLPLIAQLQAEAP
ncbi:MAG: DsbE family thiol:disulfide interchange protein [Methylovulum sp.]|uniref:DsbE family thiol:disulfide interchange protein n=1 Tax=Methylovulum sp. TaxID=1916980 RepID=UPI002607A745|nr:DsbE family thiol:disulfide interchange protein [Methylovulum sp.]MDD2723203.1 DsbE family thiol:disulfide interchange protein [Methylovulum sp.]MDD5123144.1 DsbE family thiol:disulfide interchange protein [Methylovulum sp.]